MNHAMKAVSDNLEFNKRDKNHDQQQQNSFGHAHARRGGALHAAAEQRAVKPNDAAGCENEPKPKSYGENGTFHFKEGANGLTPIRHRGHHQKHA